VAINLDATELIEFLGETVADVTRARD